MAFAEPEFAYVNGNGVLVFEAPCPLCGCFQEELVWKRAHTFNPAVCNNCGTHWTPRGNPEKLYQDKITGRG